MKIENVLLSALAGTAAMTLFSYTVSTKKNKNFKEPELLGKMVDRVVPEVGKPASQVAGWMLHCSTGLFFAFVYDLLLKNTKVKSNIPNGILIGGANGVAAIFIWKATFSLHPNPPQIDFKDFYKHLILAHLVYGTITWSMLKK